MTQRTRTSAHKQVVTSDDALLRQARTRPEAMGELYERHAVAVHRYLSRRVGAQAAEDLLAEVFVAALGARLRVVPHPSGSALPWLYGISAHVVRAHLRRSRPVVALHDRDVVDWEAVDARVDAGALRTELRAALRSLTPAERELLLLVAWEGLTPAEAATALGLTPVAARSRLHRARTRAQAALDALARTP